MVDAVVSFVVQRLSDYLIQEADLLQGVGEEVSWLKSELTMIQCFLKDAEERQEDDNRVQQWVFEIRDIAYDIEDVLDSFVVKVDEEGAPMRGFMALAIKHLCICNKAKSLYNIALQIKDLKKRVIDISHRQQVYGIRSLGDSERSSCAGSIIRQLRRASSFTIEEYVVGFEDDTDVLLEELLKEEPRRCVISIFGMGGLGKTTLARKLYNCDGVKGKFDCFAWVCVSQEYKTKDLLQRIIKSFKRPSRKELDMMEKMTEEDLERHLHSFLKRRSYLVVIDDVWKKEAWESLRRAFPDSKKGSRVIITTRIKAVAERSDERTYVHQLRFLRSDESWELFCKKAFPCNNVSQGLEELGREMVEKCCGLPLAIIVLGGLLSCKRPNEWHSVRKHLWRHLRNDSIHISQILALSFNDLAHHLKSCFLYFGLFPEDYVINTDNLIWMWIAEGFIPDNGEETMEEVAEEYLNELVNRSMIQVAGRTWNQVTRCRLHDLLRDLAGQRAKEVKFLDTYDEHITSASPFSTTSSSRRLAIHSGNAKYALLHHWDSHLRTLLCFDRSCGTNQQEELNRICSRFKLLRLLDVDECPILDNLPQEKGKLIHLKYLRIKQTWIGKLPAVIGILRSLQTLVVVRIDGEVSLPAEISKLKQLRHLVGHFQGNVPVGNLTNLQTLKYLDFCQWIQISPVNMINLRELDIADRHMVQSLDLNSIGKVVSLRSLSMTILCFPPLEPLLHCKYLTELRLKGKVRELPSNMHKFLSNLKYLLLNKSELLEDPMEILGKLPNLMILDLQGQVFLGKKMICTSKGFPQLEVLQFSKLNDLEELKVEEEAMPLLRGFSCESCCNLCIPERLMLISVPRQWEWTTTVI